MDGIVCVEAYECVIFSVYRKSSVANAAQAFSLPVLEVNEGNNQLIVNTGVGKFFIARDSFGPLSNVLLGSTELLAKIGSHTRLYTKDGTEYFPVVDSIRVEESGPVRASILAEGSFANEVQRIPLLFKSRLIFFTDSSCVRVEFQIRNPQAARHRGGLWDMGTATPLFHGSVDATASPNCTPGCPVVCRRSSPHTVCECFIFQPISGFQWRRKLGLA